MRLKAIDDKPVTLPKAVQTNFISLLDLIDSQSLIYLSGAMVDGNVDFDSLEIMLLVEEVKPTPYSSQKQAG